jgi:hypothetical protein
VINKNDGTKEKQIEKKNGVAVREVGACGLE